MFANCSKNQNKVLKCIFKFSWVLGFAKYWGLCKKKIPPRLGKYKNFEMHNQQSPHISPGSPPSGKPMTSALYCVGKNFDQACLQLNNILKELLFWSTMNKLCIHPIKSEVIILSKTSFSGPAPPMYFGNSFINVVSHTACLG